MASPTSSPVSLILLRPLPCRPLFLSKHRRQFPSPSTGCIAAKRTEQRLLRPPVTSRRRKGGGFACFSYNSQNKFPPPSDKSSDQWPILRRWDVPWEWQTVVLTMVGCGVSFVLTGLVEQSALQYVGYRAVEATIDEKAEILFLGQLSVTLVVLGVIFGITNTFRPFPDDVFRYDIKEPFKLQNGWLLWAGIGLFGAIVSIASAGAAMTYLNGDTPEREHCLFSGNYWSSSTTSGGDCVSRISNGFLDKVVSNSGLCTCQCCSICPSSSDSWTISTAVHTWYCVGVFVCSNPQSSNSHHNTRFLELRSDITANLSSAARIRYQGALGGIMKELLVFVLLCIGCIQVGKSIHPCNPK